jgi:hypothetical protein
MALTNMKYFVNFVFIKTPMGPPHRHAQSALLAPYTYWQGR